MKSKVYLETSVISYLTSRPSKTIIGAAHQQITQSWWETRDQYDLFVSVRVIRECQAGNPEAVLYSACAVFGNPYLPCRQNTELRNTEIYSGW
jgi:hypothetical protein